MRLLTDIKLFSKRLFLLMRITSVTIILFFFLFYPSTSFAANWVQLGLTNFAIATVTVDPQNSNVIYAGTNGAGIFKSIDAGITWNAINNGIPNINLNFQTLVVDPINSNILYTASGTGALYKSIDAGGSWTQVDSSLPSSVMDLAIDPMDNNILYVAEYGAACQPLFKSTDGGISWNLISLPGGLNGCDAYKLLMDPTDHNILYVGTNDGGYVYKTVDAGNTWSKSSVPAGSVRGLAIDPVNTNVLYAGIEGVGVYKSTDGSISWSYLNNSPTAIFGRNIVADSVRANTVYAAKDTVTTYRSINQGANWTFFNSNLPSLTTNNAIIAPKNLPNTLYAATGKGIYTYNLNEAPVVQFNASAPINEGGTYTSVGSFTDPYSTSWTATVNYGDGSGIQPLNLSGTDFSLNHNYKDNDNYTVTVSVTDDQGAIGTKTETVTVNNVAPVVGTIAITPSPADLNEVVTANATFMDVGVLDTHTATWNWGDGNTSSGIVTEASGSGTVTGSHTYTNSGTYTVTLTVQDNNNAVDSEEVSITFIRQITELSPAKVWISKNPGNIIRLDVLAEVYKDNTLVSSGQVNSVQVGSGGFNNADLITIPFNSFSPVDFPVGSEFKIKVSARNACSGSLLFWGNAKLWFNSSTANSHFDATINSINNNYYLRNSFLLSTTVGNGPLQSISVDAGTKCSAFKPFGTWTITP